MGKKRRRLSRPQKFGFKHQRQSAPKDNSSVVAEAVAEPVAEAVAEPVEEAVVEAVAEPIEESVTERTADVETSKKNVFRRPQRKSSKKKSTK